MKLLSFIKYFLRWMGRRPVADVEQGVEKKLSPEQVCNIRTSKDEAPKSGMGATIAVSGDGRNAGSNVGTGAAHCPYCASKNFIKSGKRIKKYETQQRYFCNDCNRFFVPQLVKGKSFPLKIILDGLSFYNTGYTLVDSCKFLKENYGMDVKDSTLSEWVKEYEPLCRYGRLRPYGLKLFSPAQVIRTTHLYHHQVYDFSVHRAKLSLLLQDFMLRNDSVTVAVEAPVYILDYKPQGTKGKEGSRAFIQLTLYALMLSRLTGLRLYDFKCAWFDENAYFEFFPLHVVYKLRERAKKEHPDQMKLFEQENSGVI